MAIADQLKTIYSNFSIGLFAHCLMRRLRPEDVLTSDRVIVGEDGLYCIPPGKTIPVEAGKFYEMVFAGSPDFNLTHSAMEFAKMLLRNLTIDSYEALFNYSAQTNQLAQMQAQGWYQFARMVRNSLTHTQHWKFVQHDLARLPVTWRSKTIEPSMNGKELSFDFYDWWDGCELWNEMYEFAKTLS
ncbi:MAG: hypothetical protein PHU49_08045 [Syntrophorhabdaceae bacterium]|nr:hypothetical protein [Syntrophorhabdaceae bacterium]MDD5243954.1 hypothetical protein [Syntrophorhabdaceae bacterium]